MSELHGFEREWFDRSGRLVIAVAEAEARYLNHHWLGTEHLLLGLIAARPDLGAVGGAGNLGPARVRAQIALVERPAAGVVEHVTLSARARTVLRLARKGGDTPALISAESIALGILREGEGVACRVLADLRVSGRALTDALRGTIAEPTTPSPPQRRMQQLVRTQLLRLLSYADAAQASADRVPDQGRSSRAYLSGALTTLAQLHLITPEEEAAWRVKLTDGFPAAAQGTLLSHDVAESR